MVAENFPRALAHTSSLSMLKLSKRQKKGIAFRERKSNRNGARGDPNALEHNEVPILEVPEDADAEDDKMEGGITLSETQNADRMEGKKGTTLDEPKALARTKRKRESESDGENVPKKKKKDKDAKQRFILFVGNLKYTTTLDSIEEHFSVCDPPPSIRLLTSKSATSRAKSKGCAFLEFTHRNALQQALKLHQSKLDGRMINVELSAGGGGNSSARLQKLKDRNKNLHEQRKKGGEKNAGSDFHPQRFSATAGVGAVPETEKTWTVADADNGTIHQGGKRNSRKSRPKQSKDWSTGVNAIPVG
ncbi:hypothetical protein D9757_005431 [Collybiopsis confluens]|uniref:RRM domain-containing protein n=1 Tax=Collybiopsis confluens TaxID=2823264 RepID=A0A8H5M975_9AGAR|nr:hypothetical protein D9757_005431 [Collybiopsis confluens]